MADKKKKKKPRTLFLGIWQNVVIKKFLMSGTPESQWKIIRHAQKLENVTHSQEKKKSIETDSDDETSR